MHSSAYPYFSVECKYCHRHPVRWHTSVSEENSRSVHAFDEIARLESVRRLGWDTIPSNDFTMSAQGNVVMLEGVGQGHGIGLCEAGARAMAATGSDFRDILAHYYPGTTIATVPRKSPRERAALVAAPHNPSE
jgi:SpoIID/LytB domain protein